MTSGPSITIAADAVANLHGHSVAIVRLPVSDTGTVPLRVTVSVADITHAARANPGASWVREIYPAHFTLRPGQTQWITFAIRVPAGAAGDRVTNFIARSAPVAGAGTGHISAGVGGTLRLTHPGSSLAAPHAPLGGAASPGGDRFPGLGFVAIVITAILIAAVAAKVLHRRHRGEVTPSRRWPDHPNR